MPQQRTEFSCPEPLASLPNTSVLCTPNPCPKAIQQEPEQQSLGSSESPLAVSTDCPRGQTAPCSVDTTLNGAVPREAKGALTLVRIFLPTSITTSTTALSIKLRSPSTLMMEHSRPFSTLGMIADGSALHHSDVSPWVQRYFISLQHVSAFSLPMMSIQ